MPRPSVRDRLPDDTHDHLEKYLQSILQGGEIRPLSTRAQMILWEIIFKNRKKSYFPTRCQLLLRHELDDSVLWQMVSVPQHGETGWLLLEQPHLSRRTRLVVLRDIRERPQKLLTTGKASSEELALIELLSEVIFREDTSTLADVATLALELPPAAMEIFLSLLNEEAQDSFNRSTCPPPERLFALVEAAANLGEENSPSLAPLPSRV